MVSLTRRTNVPAGGAVFFNEGTINGDDETQRLQPLRGSEDVTGFRKLHTTTPVMFKIFIIILMQAAVITILCLSEDFRHKCEPFFLLLYTHAAFWCISWILHHYLRWKHRMLRISGYLDFYKQTECHVRVPFYIISLWNAVLLVVSSVYHELYDNLEERCESQKSLSPSNVVGAIMTLETAILIPILVTYIVKVRRFNYTHPPPDVQREDWMMSFVRESFPAGDVGFREPNENVLDLLEKQADLIRYLKEHNAMLSHKIMQLTAKSHVEPECT